MNIINNYKLSQQYITLLNKCASLPFNLGKYQTLDDVLTKLGVDVIIEPGIVTRSIPEALDDAENYWREQANYLESLIPNADDKESALEDYQEARKNRDEVRNEKTKWLNMPLRGLYDPIKNVIKLYPDEMKTEYGGSSMNELLVSTLAHETMHAYFNRPHHESFPYVIFVEEPLAEFGMLLYLHDTGSSYYNWAYQDVSSKKTCYRYGAQLMTQHLNAGVSNSPVRKYLEAYKINLYNYPMPEVDPVGGTILLPKKSARSNSAVKVGGGRIIIPHWQDMFKFPPRYFYDVATKTLCLDGDWSDIEIDIHDRSIDSILICIYIDIDKLNQIYLGDHFTIDCYFRLDDLLSKYVIFVSPNNKQFYAEKGVPFYKKSNTPVLSGCGEGLYELYRNGKWGGCPRTTTKEITLKTT